MRPYSKTKKAATNSNLLESLAAGLTWRRVVAEVP